MLCLYLCPRGIFMKSEFQRFLWTSIKIENGKTRLTKDKLSFIISSWKGSKGSYRWNQRKGLTCLKLTASELHQLQF